MVRRPQRVTVRREEPIIEREHAPRASLSEQNHRRRPGGTEVVMRKTVVGTFDSAEDAEQVAVLLMERGFDRNDIAVRPTGASTGTTTSSPESTSWWEWLFGESEDRSYYTERARRLIEAEGGDVEASEQSHTAPTQMPRLGSAQREPAAGQPGSEEVLPVVEERLRVGKRPMASGAVRVYSRVTERPVQEQVPLREEHVRVERRPADRPIGDAAAAFREDVIEIEETAEEAVVAKEARVVEEVVVSTDVEERVEQVRDRVRHTEIDVERAQGGTERSGAPQGDDADFHRHWTETGRPRGLSYEQSGPAYRFGHELAGDGRDGGRDWSAIEPAARRRWEERSPDSGLRSRPASFQR
jgi:uncharacterized protein (TIGR02271 family)